MKTLTQIFAVTAVFAAVCLAEPPHLSYAYPAGGQAGAQTQIVIAGRNLRNPQAVYITDKTAACEIIEFIPPIRPIRDDDRIKFRERLAPIYKNFRQNGNKPMSEQQAKELQSKLPQYPEGSPLNHPLLRDIESLNPTELDDIVKKFSGGKKVDAQFNEMVSVKITVKADTKPGLYELRLLTASGLSNPISFQIDAVVEKKEREPNDHESYFSACEAPVVINGQIMPGDIDVHNFAARQGQKLVIEASARLLKPYIADAVPGWFQAVLSVYDSKGNELAFCDDYLFSPDPVIFFEVPQTDTYSVKIHDSIYRGREDFVYRINISPRPFVSSVFPLGLSSGSTVHASVTGWNLPSDTVELKAKSPVRLGVKSISLKNDGLFSNNILYSVDKLPEIFENSGNDTMDEAQQVRLPVIINAQIEKSGDADYFCFEGQKGDKVVIEINARRLNSPLDSAVELYDSNGKTVAANDDFVDKSIGLQTHHADSYLMTELTESGKYFLKVLDIRDEGGKEYGYRLRISEPMPSYELRATPSSIAIPAGQTASLRVDVIAKDGFCDDIMLGLKSMPVANYKLGGGKIPAGKDSILITITTPPALKMPTELTIESRAKTQEGILSRTALAAENMMQAFAYYQLVPSFDLLSVPQPVKWPAPAFDTGQTNITLKAGQTADFEFFSRSKISLKNKNIEAVLLTETQYIALADTQLTPDGIKVSVRADQQAPAGYKDNIVIQLLQHNEFKRKDGTVQKQKISLNELPAVAVEIVK